MSEPNRRRAGWPLLVVGLAAALVSLLALRELIPRFGTAIGPTPGDPFFTVSILEWVASRIPHGLSGVWSPPFFFPAQAVLVTSDHMLLPAAVYALLRALNGSPAFAHNALLVLGFTTTALATFLLLRRASRLTAGLAIVLSLAVVFAPWRWGQLVHLLILWAPGPPLALLTFDRLLARPRASTAAAFVAAQAVTLLSGCYLAYLTQIALAILGFVRLVRRSDRRRWIRHWRLLTLAALLIVGIGSPVYGPYLAASRSGNEKRESKEIRQYDVALGDWAAASELNRYSILRQEGAKRGGRELFPGVLLSLAGSAGLVFLFARPRRIRRRGTGLPVPLLGRAMLLSIPVFVLLAHAEVFIFLARFLPGLDAMRVPSRGYLFVLLGMAVLGGGWLRTMRPKAVVLAVSALLLLPDTLVRPVSASAFLDLESAETVPEHVTWLETANAEAVAIFPLTGSSAESSRMWRRQFHGKPIVNGYSSYLPESFRWIRSRCRTPENRLLPKCIDALKDLGATHAVVEDGWYAAPGSPTPKRIEAAIDPDALGRVRLVAFDSEALVFELR